MAAIHMLGYGTKKQLFTRAGAISGLFAQNKGASTVYLQLWDVTVEPASLTQVGSVVYAPIPIPAGGYVSIQGRFEFQNGCWAIFSQAADVKSLILGDDCYLSAIVP